MRILILLILFIAVSYVKTLGQADFEEGLPKYPLWSISSYCQNKADKSWTTTKLTYDDKKRLVKSCLYYDTVQTAEIIFNYNEQGLLSSKDIYFINHQNETMDYSRTKIYKYDLKNNLIYEGFDDNKSNDLKHNYNYDKGGKMVVSTDECNYTHNKNTYTYDSGNRVKEKYQNGRLVISYEYDHDRLIKEIHYDQRYTYKGHQETIYKYEYNEDGFLLSKTENEKVILKNIYDNGFLVESWTYYFGIDPCHSPCCGQYIVRYSYY